MDRTEQAVKQVLREQGSDVDPEAVDRIYSSAPIEARPRSRGRSWLVPAAAAAVVVALGGAVALGGSLSSNDDLTATRSGTESSAGSVADCVTQFRFDGSAYQLVLGPSVETVRPGDVVGEGTFEPCPGGQGDGDTVQDATGGSRQVHALPGVPTTQAIVLTTGSEGSVLVSTERPSDGWDTDLQAFLERAGSPLAR